MGRPEFSPKLVTRVSAGPGQLEKDTHVRAQARNLSCETSLGMSGTTHKARLAVLPTSNRCISDRLWSATNGGSRSYRKFHHTTLDKHFLQEDHVGGFAKSSTPSSNSSSKYSQNARAFSGFRLAFPTNLAIFVVFTFNHSVRWSQSSSGLSPRNT